MAIVDIVTYNGERDMLKLHIGALYDVVDKFIILEANQTFTGHPKIQYLFRDMRYFKKWWPKIVYYSMNDWEDDDLWSLARNSPNTKGAYHWQREFYIKESIQKALKHEGVKDDDLCFIGDVDEIWEWPHEVKLPAKLKLQVYAYYLNNQSNEEFWGTYVAHYKDFKGKILNHERSRTDIRTDDYFGHHFTSMGGLKEVIRKLNDSYTPESYNTGEVQLLLPERHRKGLDYLGRPFTFKISEENWPQYLKEHKKEFKHLLFTNKEEYVGANLT